MGLGGSEVSAVGRQSTLRTMGRAGLADIPAVEQEPVVCLGDERGGDIAHQLFLGLQGRFAIRSQS